MRPWPISPLAPVIRTTGWRAMDGPCDGRAVYGMGRMKAKQPWNADDPDRHGSGGRSTWFDPWESEAIRVIRVPWLFGLDRATYAAPPEGSFLRFGTRRRRPFALADIARPAAFVLLGGERLQVDHPAPDGPLEDLLEERDAPAATGAGPAALGELARHLRLVEANKILELPAGHPEAEADVVVEVHAALLRIRSGPLDRQLHRLAGVRL